VFDIKLISRHVVQRQRHNKICSKSWEFKFKDTLKTIVLLEEQFSYREEYNQT